MQRVWHLKEGEERCKPEHYVCTKRFKCLRARAEHDKGVPLADHSELEDLCKKFLPMVGNDRAP